MLNEIVLLSLFLFTMYLVPSAFIALLATRLVAANVLPSEPSPGTVWTPGQEHTIEWSVDSSAPTVNEDWTNFTIGNMCTMRGG
jgi:hypothetical protein